MIPVLEYWQIMVPAVNNEDSVNSIFSNAANYADFIYVINLLQYFKDWIIEDNKDIYT